jgi:hypothetical protein
MADWVELIAVGGFALRQSTPRGFGIAMEINFPTGIDRRKKAFAAALLLVAMGAVGQAADVITIIKGTVRAGTDQSGFFGFSPGTSLAGQSYSLLYVLTDLSQEKFTDYPGTNTPYTCSVIGQGTDITFSPIAASLVINARAFNWGAGTVSYISGGASRNVNGVPTAAFTINESYYVENFEGNSDVGSDLFFPLPPPPKCRLESPYYYKFSPTENSVCSFGFNVFQRSSDGTVIFNQKAAAGTLDVSTLVTVVDTGNHLVKNKFIAAQLGSYAGRLSQALGMVEILKSKDPAHAAQLQTAVKFVEKLLDENEDIWESVDDVTGFTKLANKFLSSQLWENREALAFATFAYSTAILAQAANSYAADPPDSNFKTVSPPESLSLQKTGNATLDGAIADYLKAASFQTAARHALERWEGAQLAGDQASTTLQYKAYEDYSSQAAQMATVLSKDNLAVNKVLPTTSAAKFPGGPAGVASIINGLCVRPLDASLNSYLLSAARLTQQQINQGLCAIEDAVRPSDINTDFGLLLTTPVP